MLAQLLIQFQKPFNAVEQNIVFDVNNAKNRTVRAISAGNGEATGDGGKYRAVLLNLFTFMTHHNTSKFLNASLFLNIPYLRKYSYFKKKEVEIFL